MLSAISWKVFLIGLVVLVTLYYVVVYWWYFSGRVKTVSVSTSVKAVPLKDILSIDDDPFTEIENIIHQSIIAGSPRSEIIYTLSKRLQTFSKPDTEGRQKMEEHIQQIFLRNGRERLSAEESYMLWKT
jgi:hypothetical protein